MKYIRHRRQILVYLPKASNLKYTNSQKKKVQQLQRGGRHDFSILKGQRPLEIWYDIMPGVQHHAVQLLTC